MHYGRVFISWPCGGASLTFWQSSDFSVIEAGWLDALRNDLDFSVIDACRLDALRN
jgi:hypothetical protein